MTAYTPLQQSLAERFSVSDTYELPATGISWLSHDGILAISGADANRFLQGQLTCDVNVLPEPGSTLGARCNPKGRIQSSFRLVRLTADTYLLAMHQEVLQAQSADLGKYAVFFKASITDVSNDWVRIGLWGQDASTALEKAGLAVPLNIDETTSCDVGTVVRVPGLERFEIWLPEETALQTLDHLQTLAAPTAFNAWQLLQIHNGLGEVSLATRESFIPQMLNMQLFNAVSFRKGCYTGQEIVARMQYLGKLKRRMFRLLMEGQEPLTPGTAIVNRETGQALGEVVSSARSGDLTEILAVLQKDAAQLLELAAVDSNGPSLSVADLPYDTELAASEDGPVN